jgi:copper chaperone CopZ
MKHTYHIEGMTCSGCETKVKKDLSNVENVTEVEVSKEDKKVSIIMSKHVEIEVLQNALGGKESKYQISLPINNSKEVVQKSCCSTGEKEHKHHEIKHTHQAG